LDQFDGEKQLRIVNSQIKLNCLKVERIGEEAVYRVRRIIKTIRCKKNVNTDSKGIY